MFTYLCVFSHLILTTTLWVGVHAKYFSHVWLCDPVSCQASLSMGFSRQEYWSAFLQGILCIVTIIKFFLINEKTEDSGVK